MKKRPTIQMIAEKAGVSRGTVDRVLNNRSYVRAEVRERIVAAIEEVGYLSPRDIHQKSIQGDENVYPPIQIGVLLPNWTGPFRTGVKNGLEVAKQELALRNVRIRVCVCETDIPREAIELLDELVNWGAQGIALCALNDILIESKVNELHQQGIPCITLNSDLPNSKRLCFVGQDYARSGRIAAELMSKCVPPDGQILAMVGNLEYNGHKTRLDGFCARLRTLGFPTEQIEVVETYNDYRVTYSKVTTALRNAPRLCAVYMANRSVTGCVDAIEAAGMTRRIRVIAHDMSERTKMMLRKGALDFTITQDLFRQGYQPLLLLSDLLQKQQQPATDQLSANISIICSQNMD